MGGDGPCRAPGAKRKMTKRSQLRGSWLIGSDWRDVTSVQRVLLFKNKTDDSGWPESSDGFRVARDLGKGGLKVR